MFERFKRTNGTGEATGGGTAVAEREPEHDEVMEPAFPQVDSKAPVELAAGLLRHYDAVLVTAKGEVTGIVTKSDLMKLL